MKISQVTDKQIKDYCGIYDDESDDILPIMKDAALARIKSTTALTDAEIEEHEDITLAYLCLINEAYQNRDYAMSWQKQLNPFVSDILHAYSKNYL